MFSTCALQPISDFNGKQIIDILDNKTFLAIFPPKNYRKLYIKLLKYKYNIIENITFTSGHHDTVFITISNSKKFKFNFEE